MASPFARIIAQLAVASAGIVSRAFVSAYSQAVHSEFVRSEKTLCVFSPVCLSQIATAIGSLTNSVRL